MLGGIYTNQYAYTNLGQLWQGPKNGGSTQEQYLYCDSAHPHQLSTLSQTASTPTCASQGTVDYTGIYDSWGNTTSQERDGITRTLKYDGLDHLVRWSSSVNSQQEWNLYDSSGERVLRRTYDGTNIIMTVFAFGVEEHAYSYSGSGSTDTNTSNTYYYTLAGQELGTWDGTSPGSPTTTFLLTDTLGSVVSSGDFGGVGVGGGIEAEGGSGPTGGNQPSPADNPSTGTSSSQGTSGTGSSEPTTAPSTEPSAGNSDPTTSATGNSESTVTPSTSGEPSTMDGNVVSTSGNSSSQLEMTNTVINNNKVVPKSVDPNAAQVGMSIGRMSRPYVQSPATQWLVENIMAGGEAQADKWLANGLRWDLQGFMNQSAGRWELVVDQDTKRIVHFLFSRDKIP